MTFFLRFLRRKVKRRRNRRSDGHTTYPCERDIGVLVFSAASTSIRNGPGRRDIRARSWTLLVCVAENSMDWRFSDKQVSLKTLETSRDKRHTVRQDSDDPLHLLLEPNFENPICFVNDETLQVPEHEIFGILTHSVQMESEFS
jgi:hypothetical protein